MPKYQLPPEPEPETVQRTFADLKLDERMLKVLTELGWEHPTPIQEKAIPIALKGDDLIGVAQTGTGKTGAFLIPIVQNLAESKGAVRALILLPTRELAIQVGSVAEQLAPAFGLRHAVVYGGTAMGMQRRALREGVDILIATPGRLIDLMGQTVVQWGGLKHLVLDEADRMLDMGFLPDVELIMRKLPMARQTMLFTATMEPAIKNIASHHMLYPKEVTIGYNRTVAAGVTQWVFEAARNRKKTLLLNLLDKLHIESGIVFCGTKTRTNQLGKDLQQKGLGVGILHSDRTQSEREKTLGQFRAGELRFLVATDVASRGLDITGISHVINFDVPSNPDDYIHRAGRTARASAKGDAITIVAPEEEKALAAVEKLLGYRLERSILADFPDTAPTQGTRAGEEVKTAPAAAPVKPESKAPPPPEAKSAPEPEAKADTESQRPPRRSRRKPTPSKAVVEAKAPAPKEEAGAPSAVVSVLTPEVQAYSRIEEYLRGKLVEEIRNNERARNKWLVDGKLTP